MQSSKGLICYCLGLLSVILIIEIMIIVITFNPNYRIFYHIVSLLGVWTGKEYFNSFMIITGILQIPFFLVLTINFKKIKEIKSVVRYSAFISGIIFCLSEVSVGVFPIQQGLFLAHAQAAFFFFHSSIFTILLFSILLLHDTNKKIPAYVGFTVVLLIINFQFWRGGLFEWIAILSMYFWIALTSIYFIIELTVSKSKIREN
ncbi:MAG: hypothetical protein ACFFEN_07790 [Candidatus Thorarchaeota archaeon]